MSQITVFVQLLEYLRKRGLKTIEMIENEAVWDYKVAATEFSIKETFHHTIKSIFEDAGNWFLNDAKPYETSNNPILDLNKSVDRMINAIKDFTDEKMKEDFIFQWGEKTTVSGAITQNIFHSVEHFSQLRQRVGIYTRSKN